MLETLRSLLNVESPGWRDALDVLLVATVVYGIIALLRRTRGAPVAVGILLFMLTWKLALALELQALGTLFEVTAPALPFAIVLLFQNHIRRALTTLGRNPLFRLFSAHEEEPLGANVALAALSLASQGLGAIVVIEREVGLRTYIDSGIPVDAKVSYELLLSIFHRRSPLHDGAVIIAHGRIAAASCLLPLTTKPQLAVKYGSRHRAAIGLSEESDAIVVVVSEERGVMSIVRDGEVQAVEARELRDLLHREMSQGRRSPAAVRHVAAAGGMG